jgi:hypothetical protein
MYRYVNIMLVANATLLGQIMLLVLLLASIALVGLGNALTHDLHMHGRTLRVLGTRQYDRRLTLAEELIKETGRDDWALRMGMVQPRPETSNPRPEGPVIM